MQLTNRFFDHRRLLILLSLLLSIGFIATTVLGYVVSRQTIRNTIISQDLPLTSGNIYSEIQKDLVRPVLVSSTMAHDTFLRDWVVKGEQDVAALSRYLAEVRAQYGAFSSFYVSENSSNYYTANGILKRVDRSDAHDIWYFRMRDLPEDYVIDVDTDQANDNTLTIFINYKVRDFSGNFLGVTGIGLTVGAVKRVIGEYQQRYQRTIYFVNPEGQLVLFDSASGMQRDLRRNEGVGSLVDTIIKQKSGSWEYDAQGSRHILQVTYLPELKWYLFVEQNEDLAMAGIRQTLYVNLAISLLVSILVIWLARWALQRYQGRIEELATTDELTGLFNRHAFTILEERLLAEQRRNPRPCSVLLIDIDFFKQINDRHSHRIGDGVLQGMGGALRASLRETDVAVRWGGEEFLVLLTACPLEEAMRLAGELRARIESARFCKDLPELTTTVSIGVAQYDGQESLDRTIDAADRALYAAKAAGRNRVCTVPPVAAQ